MTDWMWFHLLVAGATAKVLHTRAKLHIKMQFNFAVNCTEIVFALVFGGRLAYTIYVVVEWWRAQAHTHSVPRAMKNNYCNYSLAISHWT